MTQLAAAIAGSSLHILDMSTPGSSFSILGTYSLPISVRDLAWMGDHVVMVGGGSTPNTSAAGVLVVDASDPSSPTLAGSYLQTAADMAEPYRVEILGDHAVIVCRSTTSGTGTGGLTTIDLSTPTSPSLADHVANNASGSLDRASALTMIGDVAVVGSQSNASYLTTVDCSNPASLSIIHTDTSVLPTDSEVYELGAIGSLVAAAVFLGDATDGGLVLIDMSNTSSFSSAGSLLAESDFDVAGPQAMTVVDSDTVALTTAFDLVPVIDISTPSTPAVAGTFSDVNLFSPRHPDATEGGYLVVPWFFPDALTVLDISNPASISVASSASGSAWNNAFAVRMKPPTVQGGLTVGFLQMGGS